MTTEMTAEELDLHWQKYDDWLAEHMDELLDQYPGQVVAIHEDGLVFVGRDEVEVYEKIREAGLEPMPLVFRVPREEELEFIL